MERGDQRRQDLGHPAELFWLYLFYKQPSFTEEGWGRKGREEWGGTFYKCEAKTEPEGR
jgi:hypothetical protein